MSYSESRMARSEQNIIIIGFKVSKVGTFSKTLLVNGIIDELRDSDAVTTITNGFHTPGAIANYTPNGGI